jgi:hypothetical protein
MMEKEDNTSKNQSGDSNLTDEDFQALGSKKKHLRNDSGDDRVFDERRREVDFSGKELDVPGRDLPGDKKPENVKDEENQLYSQGGDENENLETTTEHIASSDSTSK